MKALAPLPLLLLLASGLTAQFPYGQGTPGSSGQAPQLSADQPWSGNGSFSYHLERGLPNAAAALLLSTAAADDQVLGARILLSLDPARFLFSAPLALDAQGRASLPGGLGAGSSALVGAQVFLQALVADPPPQGALFATSNGLQVEVTESPLIFLGADTISNTPDPFTLLDPRTLTISARGAISGTNGTTGAAFGNGGRDLFVASRFRGEISRADLRGRTPRWSTFATGLEPVTGVRFDPRRKRLYAVAGAYAPARDLVVFDADPTSATFGMELHRLQDITSLLLGEHWDLSADGNRLALYSGAAFAHQLILLDTDPASPTYLRELVRTPIEGLHGALNSLSSLHIDADGRVVSALLSVGYFTMPSGLMRYDTQRRRWIDHNPAIAGNQPIGPMSAPSGPRILGGKVTFARDGSFAILNQSSALWRIDLDRTDPAVWNIVPFPRSPPRGSITAFLVTPERDLLLIQAANGNTDSQATLMDPFDGSIQGSQLVPGAAVPRIAVQR